MTDEEIRKLAQSCAEACLERYSSMQDSEMAKEYADVMETAIMSIMETHCIVEKEKVRALYSKMELDGNHVDSDNDWAVYEAMDELEKIFGEETFNDTEK